MKNKVIIYGLLAGASFLAYKHYAKKKVKSMEVVDADELTDRSNYYLNNEEIKPKQDKFRIIRDFEGKTIRIPVSSQTIRL